GILSVVSTDHCPFNFNGQKTLGRDDFSKIPNGGPGIENRLHLMHEFGVRQGRFSMNRLVELLATNPAKLFGLYPKKGTIAVGSDADLVVFDPNKQLTISAATHHSLIDYNLYEGYQVTGAPEIVMVRGRTIVQGDELVAEPGAGTFIKRARFGEELTGATGGVAVGRTTRRPTRSTSEPASARQFPADRTRRCSWSISPAASPTLPARSGRT